ncbi:MAG: thermonuclease family protein [Phycisphaerae bacterium]|nr:thermonuclease family protein [Phycisphaerae bacterium]
MKKYRLLFSGCLLLLGIACVAVSVQNFEVPAIEKPDLSKLKPSPVIKTINSNTIVIVQDGNEATICLAGVERPRLRQGYGGQASAVQSANSAGLDFGELSRAADRFVGNLLKGESVYVVADQQQKQTDPNNCMAAYIYRSPDGLFVNAEIIRQGYGLAAMKSLFKYMNQFHRLELFARQAGKGVWASADASSFAKATEDKKAMADKSNKSIPSEKQTSTHSTGSGQASSVEPNEPNKQDAKPLSAVAPAVRSDNPKEPGNDDVIVYVTKSGTKYHSQGCRFLSKSSIPMKLKEAKGKYSPCGVCKPPQ